MAYINRKDTDGTKPLLEEGRLGYDAYVAGGDEGRIYVGTGSENIAQAKKSEIDAVIDGSTDIVYDNTASGVVATTVKEAIDELDTRLDDLEDNTTLAEFGITDAYTKVETDALLDAQNEASEIVYDNVTSGMTAVTVQSAIDEVEGRVDSIEGGSLDSRYYTEIEADTLFEPADSTILKDADIGVTVQAYDADTAKLDVAQTFTVSQRGAVTTDNYLSFDMNVTNNFKCTPTATGTLTFTNITAGQSGNILLDNSGGHIISAHSTTYISANDLSTISSAGVYWLSYFTDSTNVYISTSQPLTSAGV